MEGISGKLPQYVKGNFSLYGPPIPGNYPHNMSDMTENFRETLAALVAQSGKKPTALSRDAGLAESAIRDILSGKSKSPKIETVEAFARLFEVSVVQMLTGRNDDGDTFAPDYGAVTQIPRYDARLSAGHGQINFDASQIDIPIPFAPDFLAKKLGRASQDGLVIVEAAGESMEPTIADGDLIMLDTMDTERRAGIFGYDLGGETYVKRLEWTEYGVQIISDNSHYPERAMDAEKASTEGFRLIGRVVWVGRVF
jgi:phage repressor protein C with HTH and peptisase S24 domain